MSTTTCQSCGTTIRWSWTDAFDKFGFGDGDGLVMTEIVAEVLRTIGCTVTTDKWGLHNVIVTSITCDGVSLIPDEARVGYDDPRDYLPAIIVKLLDHNLPADGEVQP